MESCSILNSDGSVTTEAGGIYDVLHAVNKMYDFGNDDDADDDAGRKRGITTKIQSENRGIPLALARLGELSSRLLSVIKLGVDMRPRLCGCVFLKGSRTRTAVMDVALFT